MRLVIEVHLVNNARIYNNNNNNYITFIINSTWRSLLAIVFVWVLVCLWFFLQRPWDGFWWPLMVLSSVMSERKFTRALHKPGMAAQLRETVSQVIRESAVLVSSAINPIIAILIIINYSNCFRLFNVECDK